MSLSRSSSRRIVRRTSLRAAALMACALLSPLVSPVSPAASPTAAAGKARTAVTAEDRDEDKGEGGGRSDRPPAGMSVIGGDLLGEPGTQVQLREGAPQLPRQLSSKAWIVADAESGEVLAAHNAHWPLAPASTIKMLLADTLIPDLDQDALYRAQPEHFADLGAGSSAVGIDDGRTYTVDDLWHGVFLASGNDAVYALAAMNGGAEETVAQMNAHAEELQALDTHVVKPDGYDADGQLSSAYDLTLIARSGMQKPDFRRYASTARMDFPGAGKGKKRKTYEIQNTNRLLVGDTGLEPYEGVAGIKNGYTSNAGYTFTGVAERGDRVLLVTCMNPEGDGLEVYRETAALFDWGFEAADRVEPVGMLVPPLSAVEEHEQQQDGPGAGDAGESGSGTPGQEAGGNEVPLSGETAADGTQTSGGGIMMAAAFTAGGLALLALAAYLIHRRHPLPGRQRPDDGAD